MGVDFYSQVVIGVPLQKRTIFKNTSEIKRNCSCIVVGEPHFCPDCGKPFYKKVSKETCILPEYKDYEKAGPFKIFTCVDERELFIGYGKSCNSEDPPERLKNIDIENIKIELKNYLEPLNLWDENSFGIWSVPDISC